MANTQQIDPAHVDQGQTTAGAPSAPVDNGNKKPEGWDEQHGDTPVKEGQGEASKVETGKDAAKEEKAADEAPKPEESKGPLKEYVSLDNPHGQAAIDVLKEAGVDPNEANSYFEKAIKSGNLADVDWAAIEARVGSAKAFLIRTGVEGYYAAEQSKVTETVKQTHEIFGGEDNWNKVRSWAQDREKADPKFQSQVNEIRDLLNLGGAKAAAGARELLRLYNADPSSKGLNNGRLVVGDSTGTVIGTPLNRADYLAELHKLHDRPHTKAELDALNARRRAGKAQGL